MPRPPVLTLQSENFPQWYQDVINKAELADNGPVRGTMVIRPYAYALWELMQAEVDRRIKAAGADNVYFPLFIPESHLKREAQHVEGFSPELAVVTHAGGKELAEPIVVRPTSETVFGEFMAKWIQSYRDLPLLLNQWANVVRWELRPRIFLRTSEFLWQEGHTAHASQADAAAYARRIHFDVYLAFLRDVLALPVLVGIKTDTERFAGAINTMTCEVMMRDGKALQMATSHELGQNFARAFEMEFSDAEGERRLAWTTSWGSSTRMVGGLIMAHGDDSGLRVPPVLAPIQVVVVAVKDDDETRPVVEAVERELRDAGVRVRVDARPAGLGRRLTEWELKGVPVRVEIGPRDLAEGVVSVVRRDTGEKAAVPVAAAAAAARDLLAVVQESLAEEARTRAASLTREVTTIEEALEAAETGFARLPWKTVGPEGEKRLNQKAVSVRCLQTPDGGVPDDADADDLVAVVGRSY
ncbi:MAG: prolyl-tRNA synthetase [Conexibacter sp.]|nr:prolyl-tRNA synthetase [Conexibacter sp.]